MFIINTPDGKIDLDDPKTKQQNYNKMMEKALDSPPLLLKIPGRFDAKEADYWVELAREYCPGRAIVPKFV